MKKVISLILIISLLGMMVIGCSSSNQIVGKWGDGTYELEFSRNGKGVHRDRHEAVSFEYEVLNDTMLKLIFTTEYGEETEIVDYWIEDDVLSIMNEEFRRK